MDNLQQPFRSQEQDHQPSGSGDPVIYPSRPELDVKKTNVWLKSAASLALYLAFGYVVFRDLTLLLIITAIVIFHELGHFTAMKLFKYKELGIFFIPLLGAYASGTKQEVSQRQSIIILLAGPLPGILLGIFLHLVNQHYQQPLLENTAILLLFLNLLNLLPIYPLDGGQILNRLFLDEHHIISRSFVLLSALAMAWVSWKFFYPNFIFYLLLYFPVTILMRLKQEIDNDHIIRKIEQAGADLNKAYEDIGDQEYWETRNILIQYHPDLRDIPPAPPYVYDAREDKVIYTLQGLLQRLITMDLGIAGKIIVILVWVACFYSPFLLNMPMNIFQTR
ncbi:MAG: hypothetical protein GC171_10565 [Terrimonas sp.]|nr:hypothetical protein [Terrimonas sp.]